MSRSSWNGPLCGSLALLAAAGCSEVVSTPSPTVAALTHAGPMPNGAGGTGPALRRAGPGAAPAGLLADVSARRSGEAATTLSGLPVHHLLWQNRTTGD